AASSLLPAVPPQPAKRARPVRSVPRSQKPLPIRAASPHARRFCRTHDRPHSEESKRHSFGPPLRSSEPLPLGQPVAPRAPHLEPHELPRCTPSPQTRLTENPVETLAMRDTPLLFVRAPESPA